MLSLISAILGITLIRKRWHKKGHFSAFTLTNLASKCFGAKTFRCLSTILHRSVPSRKKWQTMFSDFFEISKNSFSSLNSEYSPWPWNGDEVKLETWEDDTNWNRRELVPAATTTYISFPFERLFLSLLHFRDPLRSNRFQVIRIKSFEAFLNEKILRIIHRSRWKDPINSPISLSNCFSSCCAADTRIWSILLFESTYENWNS